MGFYLVAASMHGLRKGSAVAAIASHRIALLCLAFVVCMYHLYVWHRIASPCLAFMPCLALLRFATLRRHRRLSLALRGKPWAPFLAMVRCLARQRDVGFV